MRSLYVLCAAAALVVTLPSQAREVGDLSVQIGIANVDPHANSSELRLDTSAIADSSANVHTDTQLGITIRYMWKESIGLELLASTPFSHDITADTGALGLGRIPAGDTKHLPPTFSALWFPANASSNFQPYLGLGVNYTRFFSEGVSSTLQGVLGDGSLALDDSVGLSFSAGFDYSFSDKLGVNVVVRKIDIDTNAVFSFSGAELTTDVEIDPLVYMVGLSYQF
ncbi:MAG: OmpW family outer membrane protein [Pseudomonadales bacterium]